MIVSFIYKTIICDIKCRFGLGMLLGVMLGLESWSHSEGTCQSMNCWHAGRRYDICLIFDLVKHIYSSFSSANKYVWHHRSGLEVW
jgi:hypothetical protein